MSRALERLKTDLAAAPTAFKAIKADPDDEPTGDWLASSSLARFHDCRVVATAGPMDPDAKVTTFLMCHLDVAGTKEAGALHAGTLTHIEACLPGWKKTVQVADDARKHWKTTFNSAGQGPIRVETWLSSSQQPEQSLVVHTP